MSNDLLSVPGTVGNNGKIEDLAYGWLEVLFNFDGTSGFGHAFATFTSMLGLMGGLFLGWHIIAGIVSSAYSGKVLGERYHQIWAPLRVVLGFALLIPIAGGFSSVHYILKDVVGRAAVNMGNAPIIAYINHLGQNGGDIRVASMTGGNLLQDIIEREVCVMVRNGLYRKQFIQLSGELKLPSPTQQAKTGVDIRESWTGSVTTTTWDYGACGSFGFKTSPQDAGTIVEFDFAELEAFHDARDAATAEMITELRNTAFTPEVAKNLGDYFGGRSYQDKNGQEILIALEQADILPPNLGATMAKLSVEWNAKIATEVRRLFSDAEKARKRAEALSKQIEKYGFMVAGSYERELSKIAGATSALANALPYKTLPAPGGAYDEAFAVAMSTIYASRNNDGVKMAEEGTQMAQDGGDLFARLFGQVVSFQSAGGVEQNSIDPVGSMISRGHWFMTIGVGLLAAATTLSGAIESVSSGTSSGWGSWVPGASFLAGAGKGVWMYLSQWVTYAIMILIILGVLHSYVLPMIPMIMVFIMGMSWLIMFLEAAIAAVLWAFAFIRMDGQEFFDQKQSPGVALLFNLFLRPAIGMLAFIGGLLLLPTLLGSLETIWDDGFYSQTHQGVFDYINVIKWLISSVMFCWMQWHLTIRLFGLIPTIADRVGHWMGLNSAGGYGDSQESTQAAAAMVAAGMAMSRAPVIPQPSGGARKKAAPDPDGKPSEQSSK